MMAVIAAPILIELEMASVTKKTKIKSVTLMGWIAAKTGNQLMTGFVMPRTIINIVTLIKKIVVFFNGVEMEFVMMSTIIHYVDHMMEVIAVWTNQLQTIALIAIAMKITYPPAM